MRVLNISNYYNKKSRLDMEIQKYHIININLSMHVNTCTRTDIIKLKY